MMNSKIRRFALIPALTLTIITSFMTRVAYAEMPWDSNFDSTTEKDNAALHNWGCSWGLNPPVSRSARVM